MRPGAGIDLGRQALRQHARRVVGDAAAGDVRRAPQQALLRQRANGLQIAAMHLEQRIGHRPAQFRHDGRGAYPATSNSSLRASE